MNEKTGEQPAPSGRAGRVMRLVLVVSLALNLLVAGAVAGAWFRHGGDTRPDAAAATALRDIGFAPFIAALPSRERRALGAALVERAGTLRQNREQVREDFAAMLAALRARPFDPADVKAAVDAQQARLSERQAIGQTLLLERIAAMSDDERTSFANRLERVLDRFARPSRTRGERKRD